MIKKEDINRIVDVEDALENIRQLLLGLNDAAIAEQDETFEPSKSSLFLFADVTLACAELLETCIQVLEDERKGGGSDE